MVQCYIYSLSIYITYLYFVLMSLCAVLFVAKIQLRKPGLKAILILVGIGVLEALAPVVINILSK